MTMYSTTLPDVTVIMPTLNAERTIRHSLDSLIIQTYPSHRLHVLVVDGGSSDRTCAVALSYGCSVIHNPRRQQEYGKHIGILNATTSHLMFLDSDEVLANPDDIMRRVAVFDTTNVSFVWSSGYTTSRSAPAVTHYINLFSDPFAFFVYRMPVDARFYLPAMKRRYRIASEDQHCVVFSLTGSRTLPLIDLAAGAMVNRRALLSSYPQMYSDPTSVATCLPRLMAHDPRLAILKDCPIIHHSADSLKAYVSKLRWRVLANVHYRLHPGTGFSNRAALSGRSLTLTSYFFIPYALSVLLPLADSLLMLIHTRTWAALLHTPLATYTGLLIAYYYALRLLNIRPRLPTYGTHDKS